MARDAALLLTPVMRVRVTVTGLVMEVIMMVTGAAGGIWCVGPTTVRNLDTFTMRRMTAVRNLHSFRIGGERLSLYLDTMRLCRCNINTMKIYNVQFVHIG